VEDAMCDESTGLGADAAVATGTMFNVPMRLSMDSGLDANEAFATMFTGKDTCLVFGNRAAFATMPLVTIRLLNDAGLRKTAC